MAKRNGDHATHGETEKRHEMAPVEAAPVPAELQSQLIADAEAGAGVSTDIRHNVLPFLAILQSNSPQVKQQRGEYIEGALPGMFFNTATQQIYDAVAGERASGPGVLFAACNFKNFESEWIPRTDGGAGGFVAHHPMDTPLAKQVKLSADGRLRLIPNGHQLVETMYHFGYMLPSFSPAVLAMASTALQASRTWMSRRNEYKLLGWINALKAAHPTWNLVIPPNADKRPAPAYSKLYRLQTVFRQKGGNDWFGWKITPLVDEHWTDKDGWALKDPALLEMCSRLYNDCEKGLVQLGRPMAPEEEDHESQEHKSDSVKI